MATSPFDYVNSVSSDKNNLMSGTENDVMAEKDYSAWLVNNALSYFPDTILHSNEMNRLHHLDNKMQYYYLLNILRPKKRFSKWAKKTVDSDLDAISSYYGYNKNKARDVLKLLSPDQLEQIKQELDKGGIKK